MCSTRERERERKAGQKRQKEVGTIVSVRQSSFLLFSAVQSCATKMYCCLEYCFSCVCGVAHDSYKHTAICIPEWSEPDLIARKHPLFTYGDTFLMSPTILLATVKVYTRNSYKETMTTCSGPPLPVLCSSVSLYIQALVGVQFSMKSDRESAELGFRACCGLLGEKRSLEETGLDICSFTG